MLKIEKYKTRRNLYELKMLAALSQWIGTSATLTTFLDNFKQELEDMPRQSVATVASCYQLKPVNRGIPVDELEATAIEIWHRAANGDCDRIVASVYNSN